MSITTEMSDSRADNPEPHKAIYYPGLDWLRFTLAAIVVLYHESVPLPAPIDGGLAVQVFLALSGWLIGSIVIRTSAQEFPHFFYNRATRIWPPYLFTVILLYGVSLARQGIDYNWFKYLFYDLTFTHYTFTKFPAASLEMPLGGTGNHFWSISVEEQFYLVCPLIVSFLYMGRNKLTWTIISIFLLVNKSIFSSIALGVTASIIIRDYPNMFNYKLARFAAISLAITMIITLRMYNSTPFREIFAISLVISLTFPGRRQKIGGILGAISYPLYLNHWLGGFFIQLINKKIISLPYSLTQILSFFNSIIVAYIAWYLIDRQIMIKRLNWYTERWGYACMSASYLLVIIGLIGGTIITYYK